MNITRRDALMGATAAAVVTGTIATPSATIAAGVEAAPGDDPGSDPIFGLARQLRAASDAWMTASDAFEEAAQRVGFDERCCIGLVTVETSDGPCCWGAHEIRQAVEEGRRTERPTAEQRDAALAEIERQACAGRRARRELGIEPLHRGVEYWNARFWDLQARLLDTLAASPRGVLAKLGGFYPDREIARIRAGGDPDEDLPAQWAASIYRDLERLGGEVRP